MFGGLASDKYDRQYEDNYLIKRLASYFKPHMRRLQGIVGLLVVFAIIASISPVIISAGVQALQDKNGGNLLELIIGGLLVIALLNYGIYFLRRRLTSRIVADVIGQLRKDAFNAAVERDLAFYDENKSGKIVSRITSDTQELSQVIVICTDLFEQMLEFFIIFVVLITREWRLTLLLLAMMPIV